MSKAVSASRAASLARLGLTAGAAPPPPTPPPPNSPAAATRAALALTCKAAYREMQCSPGSWHPTVRIETKWRYEYHSHPDQDVGATSLLAFLERFRPQLAADGIDRGTLSRLGIARDNWQAWPIVARCAGTCFLAFCVQLAHLAPAPDNRRPLPSVQDS